MRYKYLIAYLGQSKGLQSLSADDRRLVLLNGFGNFTDDVIKRLTELRDAGLIESAPIINDEDENNLKWYTVNGVVSRSLGGPSGLIKNFGTEDAHYAEWMVNGSYHRIDGPSRINISPVDSYIGWHEGANIIAIEKITSAGVDYFIGPRTFCTKKAYEDLIRKHYPAAGNRMHFEDFKDEVY
jgi:hypothetical protein